jgi:hypothetical protein
MKELIVITNLYQNIVFYEINIDKHHSYIIKINM